MTKHPHAELMAEYAKDAMETDRPWERWEVCDSDWRPLLDQPVWDPRLDYRRKPRTIRIGEYDVPEPVREPLMPGTSYFLVNPVSDKMVQAVGQYQADHCDTTWLQHGLIHLDRESAELHARALISLTEKDD